MSNYEASGASYSLWEFESAGSRSARDNFWEASVKAQHRGTFSPFFGWSHLFALPSSAFQGEAIREKSLGARVLFTLKPNCFSLQQSFQDSLHHHPSTFYYTKCRRFPWQQHLTYFFFITLYIYVCIACGCHLVYKLQRGQAWSGSAAGSPRSTLCCRKALYTLSTSNCH